MILPNTLKLFCISTSLSEINDLEESIISSTPLNEKFNDAKALFESDTSERANTQSFNNLRIDSNNKTETKKKVKFMVNLLKKKKGRKGNEDAKREIHDSKTYDNIIRKIQTHFLNFIISFLDDCIRAFSLNDKEYSFKKFDYKKKSDVLSENFNLLKNVSIRDIWNSMKISKKYKICNENWNEENKNNLSKLNEKFKDIFDINYLELFHYYYNNEQPLEKVCISEKTIIVYKAKSFYYLLEKNKDSKDFLIAYAKMAYLGDINSTESD